MIIFYLISSFIVVFSILAVTLKNILHSALALAFALIGVAGMYVLLNAEFLAAMQILIYVGAIITLILFAIMLTHKIQDRSIKQSNKLVFPSFIACGFIFMALVISLSGIKFIQQQNSLQLGTLLLGEYLLPFEAISLLLLAALAGAIVVASKQKTENR